MRVNILSLILAFSVISCSKPDPKEQLAHLNGYWEIHKVEFSKDSIKEYSYNQTVDYIELEEREGFRKKVRPQFDGSYQITGDAEKVTAKIENDSLNLYYSTPFNSWKEYVLEAEENEMSVMNPDGVIYHYKKFTPLLEGQYETK